MQKAKQLRLKELAERGVSAKTKASELKVKSELEKYPSKKRKLKLEYEIQMIKFLLAKKQIQYLYEFGK